MLSRFISVGNKIELQAAGKVYSSQIFDILSEDKIELVMPMEKMKLVLLPVDSEYELMVYGDNGLYQCRVRIVDRYKSRNVYILAAELIDNLKRYQRREFYRFSCALEMSVRTQEDEMPRKSVIVDISGGGIRFLSKYRYETDSRIFISFQLTKNRERKRYEAEGRILSAKPLENRPDTIEYRVQYLNMENDTREEIIKYIFEEERKGLRKERLE